MAKKKKEAAAHTSVSCARMHWFVCAIFDLLIVSTTRVQSMKSTTINCKEEEETINVHTHNHNNNHKCIILTLSMKRFFCCTQYFSRRMLFWMCQPRTCTRKSTHHLRKMANRYVSIKNVIDGNTYIYCLNVMPLYVSDQQVK